MPRLIFVTRSVFLVLFSVHARLACARPWVPHGVGVRFLRSLTHACFLLSPTSLAFALLFTVPVRL